MARNRRKSLQEVPTMAEFLHKQKVVHQYRQFLKCIHRIPDKDYQSEARLEVQQRYRQLARETDTFAIQMAVREGDRRLAQVQSLTGYGSTVAATTDKDSWINTPDPEDPRGRVGVEWPWDAKKH
jgi:hypothetical protein